VRAFILHEKNRNLLTLNNSFLIIVSVPPKTETEMPQPTNEQTAIAATLRLEAGHLRAELRVEFSLANPQFFRESPLTDLRKNVEACLPIALAEVAPLPLRQILERAEALLLARAIEDQSSGESLLVKLYPSRDTAGGIG
jgi:hypothetical protein